MRRRHLAALTIATSLALACGGKSSSGNSPADREAAAPGVAALAAGDLADARAKADRVLAANSNNALAAATRGLARWVLAGDSLVTELGAVIEAAEPLKQFNHARTRQALESTLAEILAVRADFAVAARDPNLALEVCLACWERDWNHSGEIDRRDRMLLAIERDKAGQPLPENDPRRRPRFRFDVGDAHWAHAMASFQAAALEIILAFDGTELDKLFGGMPMVIELPLRDPERVVRARTLILEGLDSSDRAREAYLAETDDVVEWVPNPNQTSSPMPLPVDAELYATWKAIIGDVRDLVRGDTGISIGELSQLSPELRGMTRPTGTLDVGRMLREPKTIRIPVAEIVRMAEAGERAGQIDTDAILELVFGETYVKSMTPSPLTKRLLELRSTLETGGETFERKLMYLIWLN